MPETSKELEIQIGMRWNFGRRFVIVADQMASLNLPAEAAELRRMGERMVASATRDLEKLYGPARAQAMLADLDEWITGELLERPSFERPSFPPELRN